MIEDKPSFTISIENNLECYDSSNIENIQININKKYKYIEVYKLLDNGNYSHDMFNLNMSQIYLFTTLRILRHQVMFYVVPLYCINYMDEFRVIFYKKVDECFSGIFIKYYVEEDKKYTNKAECNNGRIRVSLEVENNFCNHAKVAEGVFQGAVEKKINLLIEDSIKELTETNKEVFF